MKNLKKTLVRIAVTGAAGRMGNRILTLASLDPRFQIVGGVEQSHNPLVGRFLPMAAAPVVENISELLPKTDVVIDFSSPISAIKTAERASKFKKGLVVGTTGFNKKGINQLKKYSRRIPIVLSPNMSRGMNVLFRLVEKAVEALSDYDIEVIEAHHNLKKDSPSGSALRLADVAAQASGRSHRDFVFGRHGLLGARKKKEIGVMSLRAGDIVGDHTVLVGTGGERLELTHRAHSRDAFASGALDAAVWAYKKRPGLYNMFDVLKI